MFMCPFSSMKSGVTVASTRGGRPITWSNVGSMRVTLGHPAVSRLAPKLRCWRRLQCRGSHVAPVLPADLEERLRDLLQRADPRGVHQHREDVVVADRGLLEPDKGLGGGVA